MLSRLMDAVGKRSWRLVIWERQELRWEVYTVEESAEAEDRDSMEV